jgi:hypothetical protein
MNHPVDMHPEDLLDREQYGLLSLDEQRRLDGHCVRCSACALIRGAVRDFSRERQVNSADPVLLDRLVEAALGNAAPPSSRYPVQFIGRRRRRPWAVAAVVMFAATGAGASFWSVRSVRNAVVERSLVPMIRLVREPRSVPNPRPALPRKAAVAVPTEPVAERIVAVLPVPAAPRTLAPRTLPPREPIAATRPKPSEEAAVSSVDDVFASFNEAKRRRDTPQAMQLYRRLQAQFPGTRQESTSRVILGRLLLDLGEDIGTALTLFSRYLDESPNGTLAEEARAGRALALMRLGRPSEERQAWLGLLSAHPRSVHAERARRRLDELR